MYRMFLAVSLMALGTAAIGCGGSATGAEAVEAKLAEPKGALPVTVAPVSVRPSVRRVNFVGTLYGNEEVTLSSQIEGQIATLTADLGDEVDAGQLLAQIDDAQWRARLREAEAMLAKAQADEARAQQLVGTNIISKQEYESMKTNAAVARAQRDTMTVSIEHARVAAPLRAAVARRFVSVGEYVRPGSPVFSLVALDPLKLRGDVPERFAHELQVGQEVEVGVDAAPGIVFTGRLSRISPASNPQSRSVAVEALVDNGKRQLKPGFFANAAVITRTDDRALMVPQDAVVSFAGVTKVFVVRDGVAQEREVEAGTRSGDGLVEIISGVAAGDMVATSGLSKLENGASVSIRTAADPAN
jgi:membrane fusion protein (multidrug efflux system)